MGPIGSKKLTNASNSYLLTSLVTVLNPHPFWKVGENMVLINWGNNACRSLLGLDWSIILLNTNSFSCSGRLREV